MRTLSTFTLSLTILALSVATAFAQPAPSGANPIAKSIQSTWRGTSQLVKASAELMPEENYSFRPVDTVRTFGEILAHVAGANYVFCSAAKGEKPPHSEEEFEKTAKTKADIVKAVNESIAYCDAVYQALDDAKAAEMVTAFGRPAPRAAVLMMNTSHVDQHYGNLVTYFRIKGLVPPSSRRSG